MSTPKMPWCAIALNRTDGGQLSQFCTFVTDNGSALALFTSEDLIRRFIGADPATVHVHVVRTPQQLKDMIAGLSGIDPPLRYIVMNPASAGGVQPSELRRLEDVIRDAEEFLGG